MKTLETMLGVINPAALPVLRIAGALFLIINLLAGAYLMRHRHRLFGRDRSVDGDRDAVRQLQVIVIVIPWLFLTARLVVEWAKLWVA
ncbi:MAG TPA: hypothetical protein VLK27_06010 [Chthoniobacterales bacterium]|nr:hypothetical protein [Chthoniobacterales bacterium]